MVNSKKVPEIRFSGFTDPWEQRKLGDEVIEILAGGDIDKSKTIENGKYPIYANALTNNGIVGYYDNYYRVKAPAVTVTGRGEVGFAQARMADFTPVVRLLAIRSNHDCYFLENAINNHKIVIESTGVPQLTIPQLSSYCIFFSRNDEEEIRVGEYFHKLSNLITLHQRKLEKLKTFKKAMLDKMFPKNGELVPEIRFSGFTDPWEQRKVLEVTKFHKQGFYTTEEYGNDKKYYLLRGTDLTENKLILNDTPKINATEKDFQAFKTEVGDFLIVRSGTVGTYGIVYDDIKAIFGSYLINFRFNKEQVCNEFFGYFYQSELFKKQLNQIIQRSANTNINAENIKSTSIMLPSLDEQKEISDYLIYIDRLITLHQRKLEKLQNIKKSMLNKMFI